MGKLYFKYGAMGSSKTAQALITKFNYEERGMKTLLLKPATDNRSGANIVKSRIGLEAEAIVIDKDDSLITKLSFNDVDVIIVDECQFFSINQINDLRAIADMTNIDIICFGLRTDFQTNLFSGSKRLFEVADTISEIKTMCACGKKATINARINSKGKIVTEGDQIFIGGNDSYIAMCHNCYQEMKFGDIIR